MRRTFVSTLGLLAIPVLMLGPGEAFARGKKKATDTSPSAQAPAKPTSCGKGKGPAKTCVAASYQAGPAAPYSVPNINAIAVGDLNCDGVDDIVVGDPNSTRNAGISVLLNTGDGTLGKPVLYPDPTDNKVLANNVEVADLNGDGWPDVLVAGGGSRARLFIWMNNGDGTLKAAGLVGSREYGNNYSAVSLVDLNGDGAPDIVMSGDTTVYVFLNSGKGQFAGATEVKINVDGAHMGGLAIADLNGDGRPDIAWLDFDRREVTVLLNDKRGNFPSQSKVKVSSEGVQNGQGMVASDFNGDGKADLAMLKESGAEVEVAFGKGDGTFGATKSFPLGAKAAIWLAAGDLNGDGKADLAASDDGRGVQFLLNNGSGAFAAPYAVAAGTRLGKLALGDFGGSRVLGVAAVEFNRGEGTVHVLPGHCN
jgi:hypothetical protein